jgi:hypothetical protein
MLFGVRFDPRSAPKLTPPNTAQFLEPSPECPSRVGSMLEADGGQSSALIAERRLRPDLLTGAEALEQARTLARAERDGPPA